MEKKFVRTCQECGHKQESKHPNTYKNETWRELKCKKCKSISMDYGTYVIEEDELKDLL